MSLTTYSLTLPEERNTCVVFASPHSGRDYRATFRGQSVLDEMLIRSSEDAFVDDLYADAPANGAPLLAAVAPRAFIDLNRAAEELDPALITGAPTQRHNPRISSGLGVIPRVVSGGRAIYSGKMSMEAARQRIGNWWRPYHDRLQRLLDESQYYFGRAILIDCHSMPLEALTGVVRSGGSKADVVLGDRFGTAAASAIVDRIEAAFASEGLRVARNAPFAGAYVTQHYGKPARNQHVVQVEIDRGLYMNETTLEPLPAYADVKALIGRVTREITEIGRGEDRLAAE